MKIRQGFVSNSSSSSFVVVGWELNREEYSQEKLVSMLMPVADLDKYAQTLYQKDWANLTSDEQSDVSFDIIENTDIAILDCGDDGAPAGKTVIGRYIGEGSQSIKDIVESLVARAGHELGLNVNDLRIISGIQVT